jgi:hypothetical protein
LKVGVLHFDGKRTTLQKKKYEMWGPEKKTRRKIKKEKGMIRKTKGKNK